MVLMSDPDRGQGLERLSIVMIILPTIAVALRVWSRLTLKSQRFWWDDFFVIANLLVVLIDLSIVLKWISDGLGRHISQLGPEEISLGPKYLFAGIFFYDLGISLPRYSAILFYMRIFRLNSTLYRISVWIGLGLVTAWILFAIPSTIFQCTPIRKAWIPLTPGHCLHNYQWFLGSAISSVLIDFYNMLLPLPVLWTLHAGGSRKMVLIGFFFCAYCVLIVSLGRLVVTVQTGQTFQADLTWNTITFFHWALSEGSISIVSICLPHINHLVQRARQHGVSSLFTRREYASSSSNMRARSALPQDKEGFQRIGRGSTVPLTKERRALDQPGYTVSASADQHAGDMPIALGEVHMRQEIRVGDDERWGLV